MWKMTACGLVGTATNVRNAANVSTSVPGSPSRPRGLTRKGLVNFNGETRRILGTVSVNHIVIDVDGVEAAPGDVVEIVSREDVNTLEAVSRLAGIMTYSFCIALNPLTPRVYTRDGIPVALSELKLTAQGGLPSS